MTDWLEWVLEQVPEEDQAERTLSWGMEPPQGQKWPWEGNDRPASQDRRPDGPGAVVNGRRPAWEQAGERTGDRSPAEGGTDGMAAAAEERRAKPGGDEVRSRAGSGRQPGPETPGWDRAKLRAEPMEQAGIVRDMGRTEDRADGLYRAVVRAGRELEGARPAERTAVTRRQAADAPSLTVDELDRAVRRDSRRYDGGMEIY